MERSQEDERTHAAAWLEREPNPPGAPLADIPTLACGFDRGPDGHPHGTPHGGKRGTAPTHGIGALAGKMDGVMPCGQGSEGMNLPGKASLMEL